MTRPEVFVNAFVKKGDFEVNVNKYQTAQHMQIFPRQILDNIYHKFKIVLHLSKASFKIVGYWTSNLHNSELAVYIKALYLSSGPKTWDFFSKQILYYVSNIFYFSVEPTVENYGDHHFIEKETEAQNKRVKKKVLSIC